MLFQFLIFIVHTYLLITFLTYGFPVVGIIAIKHWLKNYKQSNAYFIATPFVLGGVLIQTIIFSPIILLNYLIKKKEV